MDSKPKGKREADVARLIEKSENIFVMLGAGVSTSAGIPDFRSPGTGLYANLARLKLPYPEAVFEINFFRENPKPFYALAAELRPGRFRPTITHSFVRLLADNNRLNTCFTQNIDTLERRAGIPSEKIIEAHGSFASHKCIECKEPYDDERMTEAIKGGWIPRCEFCSGGLVKPNIVFFGEALPKEFFVGVPKLKSADLLIVMGTSLTVHPFAMLAELVPQECPRILINGETVGSFGGREKDILCLGQCDDVVRKLTTELGWEEALEKAWEATKDTVEPADAEEGAKLKKVAEEERLAQEIEKLTGNLGKALALDDVTAKVQKKQDAMEGLGVASLIANAPSKTVAEVPSKGEKAIPDSKDEVAEVKVSGVISEPIMKDPGKSFEATSAST